MSAVFTPSAQTLAGVQAFTALPAEDREAIAARCRGLRVETQQSVVSEQDQDQDVYFIVSGRVRVRIFSLAGKEITFRDLSAGDMFGEMAAIDGKPRSASIVALENATLLRMSAQDFQFILRNFPDVAMFILRSMAELIRSLSERIVEFSALGVKNRIHAELLRLARDHLQPDEGAVISPVPTHAEIASRISTHREAVTRELNRLDREGLVRRCGHSLIVPDLDALARMVERVKGS